MTQEQRAKIESAAKEKGYKVVKDAVYENGLGHVTGRGFAVVDKEGFIVAKSADEAAVVLGLAEISEDGTVAF